MNHGPLKTFTQENSIEEYLPVMKLPIWETHWTLFKEQSQKNEHVLGFGDCFLPPLACLYENIHYMQLLKGSEGQVCCLLWKTCVLGLKVKHRRPRVNVPEQRQWWKLGCVGRCFCQGELSALSRRERCDTPMSDLSDVPVRTERWPKSTDPLRGSNISTDMPPVDLRTF